MSVVRYDKTFTYRFEAFVQFTESIVDMDPDEGVPGYLNLNMVAALIPAPTPLAGRMTL
jgi:hypothetical protein